MMSATGDRERANLDPGSVFAAPSDVLAAHGLSHEDKKSILIKWEADADALLRAADEGMEGTPGHRSPAEILRAIHAAIAQLENAQPPVQIFVTDVGC
jgi:hypothetical protein